MSNLARITAFRNLPPEAQLRLERGGTTLEPRNGAAGRMPSIAWSSAAASRCAAAGHDLLHRGEDRAQGHAASAGLKPRGADLDRAEQRPQPPSPLVLQRSLFPTSRATSPDLAVLLGLRLNKMTLQAGQDRLGLCK
jgi:hypothetical protein